jgi:hypothetical protein
VGLRANARLSEELDRPDEGHSGGFCCLAIGVPVPHKEAILGRSAKALKGVKDRSGTGFAAWTVNGVPGNRPFWVVGA